MKTLDLVAPAGSLVALKAAVDKGADAVYLGLRNATNARNFGGLNFTDADIRLGVEYAHQRGKQVLFAINTYPQSRIRNLVSRTNGAPQSIPRCCLALTPLFWQIPA